MNPRLLQILIAILALGIIGYGAYASFKILYKPAPKAKVISLVDYINTPETTLRLTVKGPVTAPEKHVEQTFTITPSSRSLAVYKGYSEAPSYTESDDFNQTAFEDLMRALQNAGYTNGATTKSNSTEIGACPQGTRTVYELFTGQTSVFRTWSSSCGTGTFNGSAGTVRSLFQNQYPTYGKLTSDLRL